VLLAAGGDRTCDGPRVGEFVGVRAGGREALQADRVLPGLHVVVVADLHHVRARLGQVERDVVARPETGDQCAGRAVHIDVGREPGVGRGAGAYQLDPVAGGAGERPLVLLGWLPDRPGHDAALGEWGRTRADRRQSLQPDGVLAGLGVVVVAHL